MIHHVNRQREKKDRRQAHYQECISVHRSRAFVYTVTAVNVTLVERSCGYTGEVFSFPCGSSGLLGLEGRKELHGHLYKLQYPAYHLPLSSGTKSNTNNHRPLQPPNNHPTTTSPPYQNKGTISNSARAKYHHRINSGTVNFIAPLSYLKKTCFQRDSKPLAQRFRFHHGTKISATAQSTRRAKS
jgi:hypothetical protein